MMDPRDFEKIVMIAKCFLAGGITFYAAQLGHAAKQMVSFYLY